METETTVDNCPERMYAVESMETETAVDNCPERMDAADAEAPRPPRIKTVVEFWSGMGVEMAEVEAAGLTMRRFFWCTRRKKIQHLSLIHI